MNENPESSIHDAELLQTARQSPGWAVVTREIENMRREAFSDWADLPLDAPVEKILRIKVQEAVLAEFMRRLDDISKRGMEARERTTEEQRAKAEEAAFLDGRAATNEEIDRLIKGPPISEPTTLKGAG